MLGKSARLVLVLLGVVLSLSLVAGPATAWDPGIGSVLTGDLVDSSALEGAAFVSGAATAGVAVGTIGVLGVAEWETKDTWVPWVDDAWDAITGGGFYADDYVPTGWALSLGAYDASIGGFDLTYSLPGSQSLAGPTVYFTGHKANGNPFTGSSYHSSQLLHSGTSFFSADVTSSETVDGAYLEGSCPGGKTCHVTAGSAPSYAVDQGQQTAVVTTTCTNGTTTSDLVAQGTYADGGVHMVPCVSLGDDWYPKQVQVTRTGGGHSVDDGTETFPDPTHTKTPIPGPSNSKVLQLDPTTGTPTQTTPDVPGTYDPKVDPPPNKTTDDGGHCFPTGWGKYNPIDWVYAPVKCALVWAFEPKVDLQTRAVAVRDVYASAPPFSWFVPLAGLSAAVPGGGCPDWTINVGTYSHTIVCDSEFVADIRAARPWLAGAMILMAAWPFFRGLMYASVPLLKPTPTDPK